MKAIDIDDFGAKDDGAFETDPEYCHEIPNSGVDLVLMDIVAQLSQDGGHALPVLLEFLQTEVEIILSRAIIHG